MVLLATRCARPTSIGSGTRRDGGCRRPVQGLQRPASATLQQRSHYSSRTGCHRCARIWDAANASLRWYEDMDRLVTSLSPLEFAYSYMTRTGRVDHAEVRRRDPRLAAAYEALHPEVAT